MANEDLSKLKIEKSPDTFQRRRKRKTLSRVIGAAIILALIVVLYAAGVFSPPVKVTASTVSLTYPSQAFTVLNASGYVVAQRKAAIASKTTGRLVWIGVEEGSRVKAGQIVARLENEDVIAARNQAAANLKVSRANLDQAQAELSNAKLTYERDKQLVKQGYIAKAEFDAAEASYKKAQAAVESAEAAIRANTAALKGADVAVEYTLIRAPFDAVVLTKDADVGDIITPLGAAANAKAAVVTIADMSSLQVEADVSESNIGKISLNQPAEIQLDALPDTRFRGEVHMIVPTADRSKATVMVKVRFIDKDPRILPEMSAKVAFLSRPVKSDEQKPLLAIPPASLVSRNGKYVVYKIVGNTAVETSVEIGQKIGDVVEVRSGVKAGDRVVMNPPKGLDNKDKVSIEEK